MWLLAHAHEEILAEDLVRWFHAQVFSIVTPFAGVVRGVSCPHDVDFGPHIGAPWQECEARMSEMCARNTQYISALDEIEPANVGKRALDTACAHHGEFIKIHPFLNGNGRIGRLCLNYFAVRYGLNHVSVAERERGSDYVAALSAYIMNGRLAPLVDYWQPVMNSQNAL